MMNMMLLRLLQLTSPSLPVGAYSYSEGLETLVQEGIIIDAKNLQDWLTNSLCSGTIRVETAVLLRTYQAVRKGDLERLTYWNLWLSANRETEELRQQSWQMGRALLRLLEELQPDFQPWIQSSGNPCNYAIAFGVAAAVWEIEIEDTVLGYLSSWASNLITAGVKLIPLGQTQGQQILLALSPILEQTAIEILHLEDDELNCCSWGLTLASMTHETLYSRLFRS